MQPAKSYCPLCHVRYADREVAYCRYDGGLLRPIEQLGAHWLGRVIDQKYRVDRFLGAGATAEVYAASTLDLGRHVALKILNEKTAADPAMKERFRREARLVSSIAHNNVVSVEDFGSLADGTLYMVMELLHGCSLESFLESSTLNERTIIELALQICDGLAAAHDRQIVHRDIKPANVFIHRSQLEADSVVVKLLDLGLAKSLGGEAPSNLTMTGTLFGTPEYMSPEQALGESVDTRTDLYAVGIMLYEMLFGSVPFSAPSFIGVLTRHMTEPPEWPHTRAQELDLDLRWKPLVLGLLAKKRRDRPDSARAVALQLQQIAQDLPADQEATISSVHSSGTHRVERISARPSVIELVGPVDAQGTNREVVELAPDVFWVGRRHGTLLECNSYLCRYRGNRTELSVLIDPGPPKDLAVISAKVAGVLGSTGRLDLMYLNHQDPDLCGNAAALQQANPRIRVICSEDTWRLVQFYGLRPQNHCSTESYANERMRLATGHVVRFVPTPYCHFRGAVMYYDKTSRILFSGDLFGGLSHTTTLWYDESAWRDIAVFHEMYMPSSQALRLAVERIRLLDPPPRLIAPQHGSLIGESHIAGVLAQMERLVVGVELMQGTGDKARYVALANALVQGLREWLEEDDIDALLRLYNADGSFPNLFVLRDEHTINDIKVDPRAAIRALVRDALELCHEVERDQVQAYVLSTVGKHGLSGLLRRVD